MTDSHCRPNFKVSWRAATAGVLKTIMLKLIASLLLTVVLVGCESITPSFYTLDVRQGNVLEKNKVAQLHIGMSKRQVQSLLGVPLIEDPFHHDRWDYVYLFYPSGSVKRGVKHRLTLFFTGDTLSRMEGDMAAYAGTSPAPAQSLSATTPLAPDAIAQQARPSRQPRQATSPTAAGTAPALPPIPN